MRSIVSSLVSVAKLRCFARNGFTKITVRNIINTAIARGRCHAVCATVPCGSVQPFLGFGFTCVRVVRLFAYCHVCAQRRICERKIFCRKDASLRRFVQAIVCQRVAKSVRLPGVHDIAKVFVSWCKTNTFGVSTRSFCIAKRLLLQAECNTLALQRQKSGAGKWVFSSACGVCAPPRRSISQFLAELFGVSKSDTLHSLAVRAAIV